MTYFNYNCLLILKQTNISNYYEIFCEKRNASTPLGIEPRSFRLPVECSVIWATEVPQLFSQKLVNAQSWLRINRKLFSDPAEWKRSFFHRKFRKNFVFLFMFGQENPLFDRFLNLNSARNLIYSVLVNVGLSKNL